MTTWVKSKRKRLCSLQLILLTTIVVSQILWSLWIFPNYFHGSQGYHLPKLREFYIRGHSGFQNKKQFTLYLITPSIRPSFLCISIFHVMRLHQCLDIHWVIVHHTPDARLFQGPLFRDVFPWITELRAFHKQSISGNHERNVGIDHVLKTSQSDLDLIYFLDDDNVLPLDICASVPELYKLGAEKMITANQDYCGWRYTEPGQLWQDHPFMNGFLRTDTGAWFVPVKILKKSNEKPFWHLDRYEADTLLMTKLSRSGPYFIPGQEDNIALLPTFHFHYNELVCEQRTHPPVLWNDTFLNQSLKVYQRQVQMMKDVRRRLPKERRMNRSDISLRDYVHILFNVRKALNLAEATYVEIGVWKGVTSIFMSRHALTTNVIGIDPFVHPNQLSEAQAYRQALQGKGSIDWIKGDSNLSVPALKKLLRRRSISILFINGDDHRRTRTNFELYEPLVGAGGYIVFHNFLDTMQSPGVREAIMHLIQEEKITREKYTIIGSVHNVVRAGPPKKKGQFYYDWQDVASNEFIIQKKHNYHFFF